MIIDSNLTSAMFSQSSQKSGQQQGGISFASVLSSVDGQNVPGEGEIAATTSASSIVEEFAEMLEEETPEEIIHKLANGGLEGLMEWKIDQLKKQMAEDVMMEMGVTKDGIESMPPEDMIEMMKKIMEMVEQKLEEMVKQSAVEQQQDHISNQNEMLFLTSM